MTPVPDSQAHLCIQVRRNNHGAATEHDLTLTKEDTPQAILTMDIVAS